jgi:hypothetical protein
MYKDKAKPPQGTHTSQSSHWNQSRLTPFNSANHKPGSPRNQDRFSFNRRPNSPQKEPINGSKSKGQGGERHTTTGSSRRGTPASSAGKRAPLAADWEDAQSTKPSALRGSAAKWGRDDAFTLSVGTWQESAAAGFDCFRSIDWVPPFSCAGQGRLPRFLPRTALPTVQPPAPDRRSSPPSPRRLPDRADPV